MEIEMRMASIVIPDVSDGGQIFVPLQREIIETFRKEFGGATAYECFGFWNKSQRQISCTRIDVAFHTTDENIQRFVDIVKSAADECAEGGVHSIMAIKPDGVIIFVEGDLYDGTKKV